MKGLVKGNPTGFRSNFVCTIVNYSIDEGNKGRVIPKKAIKPVDVRLIYRYGTFSKINDKDFANIDS